MTVACPKCRKTEHVTRRGELYARDVWVTFRCLEGAILELASCVRILAWHVEQLSEDEEGKAEIRTIRDKMMKMGRGIK